MPDYCNIQSALFVWQGTRISFISPFHYSFEPALCWVAQLCISIGCHVVNPFFDIISWKYQKLKTSSFHCYSFWKSYVWTAAISSVWLSKVAALLCKVNVRRRLLVEYWSLAVTLRLSTVIDVMCWLFVMLSRSCIKNKLSTKLHPAVDDNTANKNVWRWKEAVW